MFVVSQNSKIKIEMKILIIKIKNELDLLDR